MQILPRVVIVLVACTLLGIPMAASAQNMPADARPAFAPAPLLLLPAASAPALDVERPSRSMRQGAFTRRDPAVAGVLSLIWPGMGQFYNGPSEKDKGVKMAVLQGALFGGFYVALYNLDVSYRVLPLFYLGMLGNSVYSIYDAATQAGELNRANGLAGGKVEFGLVPLRTPDRSWGVMAAMRVRF